MKYKVGDRVKYGSEICTVTKVLESQGKFKYRVQSDTWYDIVNEDEMIERLVEDDVDLIPKFGEFSDNEPLDIPTMTTDFIKEHGLPCPEGCIFKDENGNVINATKIVLEKKKKEYPKTYEECCKVLDIDTYDLVLSIDYRSNKMKHNDWKRLEKLNALNQILVCRDAYWKIAGEEMGLGKPWEPDYRYKDEYYSIYYNGFGIIQCNSFQAHVFIFPTEEMRDAFYENFKEEIEICKELL